MKLVKKKKKVEVGNLVMHVLNALDDDIGVDVLWNYLGTVVGIIESEDLIEVYWHKERVYRVHWEPLLRVVEVELVSSLV